MSDLNKISHDNSLSVLSIDEAKWKSPFDSGIVWLINRKSLFTNIGYTGPEDLWRYKTNDHTFDYKKYFADEIMYFRHHVIQKMKDKIQEKIQDEDFVLTQRAGVSETEARAQSRQQYSTFKTAMESLDYSTLRTLFADDEELLWYINDIQKDYGRKVDYYRTTQESFINEQWHINLGFLSQKLPTDYLSWSPQKLLLMIATYEQQLTEHDYQQINDAIMKSLLRKIEHKQYLQFLEILDQVDFFQQTYKDIGFRFARNPDLPQILRPDVLRTLWLHSSIDGFKNAIRKVYTDDKVQQDLLLKEADEYYDHDNFFYWRVITTSPQYSLKRNFAESKSTQNIDRYKSLLAQTLST